MSTDVVIGTCKINITVKKPTSYVIIHAYKYENFSSKLMLEAKKIDEKNAFFFEKNQYHVMEFDRNLSIGNYVLEYNFTYKLRDNLKGFYKSSYKNNNGVDRYALTS